MTKSPALPDSNLVSIMKEAKIHPQLEPLSTNTNSNAQIQIPIFKPEPEKENAHLVNIMKEVKSHAASDPHIDVNFVNGDMPVFKPEPEKENSNLVAIMKEAKDYLSSQNSGEKLLANDETLQHLTQNPYMVSLMNESDTRRKSSAGQAELVAIAKEIRKSKAPELPQRQDDSFEHLNANPYLVSIMTEMRRNSASKDTANLSGIMSDIIEDDKQKVAAKGENLATIMAEITEHNAVHTDKSRAEEIDFKEMWSKVGLTNADELEEPTSEKPSHLIKIMDEIKTSESASQPTSNLNKVAAEIMSKEAKTKQKSEKNPRIKASERLTKDPSQITRSSVDIYARRGEDNSDDESDEDSKARAFARLSSPDISDEASKMKFAASSAAPYRPTQLNIEEMNIPVGEKTNFGILRLTAHYDELRTRLSITVHEAKYIVKLFLNLRFKVPGTLDFHFKQGIC